MTNQVRLNVGGGVFDAVANPSLGAEMDDAIEIVSGHHLVQGCRIGKIDLFEPEAVVEAACQTLEPGPLEGRIVVIIEVVDPDHLVAALEQYTRRGRADEPGGTRHQ